LSDVEEAAHFISLEVKQVMLFIIGFLLVLLSVAGGYIMHGRCVGCVMAAVRVHHHLRCGAGRLVIMVLNQIAERRIMKDTLASELDGGAPPEDALPGDMPEIF
jgi:hypothetical protein